MHFAYTPLHVGRRKGYVQAGGDALLVHLIHIIHPDRHPDALVTLGVSSLLKGSRIRAAASATLRSLTKEDAGLLTGRNRAKCRRHTPVPQFLPSPLLQPRDCGREVGYIQNRIQTVDFHGGGRITPAGRGLR